MTNGVPSSLSTRWIHARMIGVAVLVLGLLAMVLYKAYRLHAVEGTRLREMAEQQCLKEVWLPPRRGTIVDRNGTPLAVSVDVDSVYANPRLIGSAASQVAHALAPVLGMDPQSLQKQLGPRRYFAWLKRRIAPREAAAVRVLKLQGVYLTKESRRFYPNDRLGSSVVGFAGLDGRGLEGLELGFDKLLRGSPTRVAGLRDALGRPVFSEGDYPVPSAGHELELTLDKSIQYEAEQAIREAYKSVKRDTGWVAAIVLEARTGELLAMASEPSFDPNRYQKSNPAQWRNRAITDAFEPGSTMKVFSVTAALNAEVVKAGEIFDVERGRWRVGRHTIHDAHGHDRLDVAGIIQKSSNIGASKIAFRLGKERLYSSLRQFGFGQPSGIPLPGERSGVLRQPGKWSLVGLANVSFGQGMTTTMMQLAQGLTALANDGRMMRPRVIRRIRDEHGRVVKEYPPQGQQVISAAAARTMLQMMVGVTEAGGTAVAASLDRYTVAGKTGTAQKVDPATGTYSGDRYLSSFMGVVPASQPRLAVVVAVNEPDGPKHFGGEVAGPVFKRIAEQALTYLGVKPDRPPRDESKSAVAQAKETTHEGSPQADAHAGGERLESGARAPALPGAGQTAAEAVVPDFTGMSIAEAIAEARKAGLQLEFNGSGQAVAQSPGPGPAARGTRCRVSFRPPI